jgi:hypothetical protein
MKNILILLIGQAFGVIAFSHAASGAPTAQQGTSAAKEAMVSFKGQLMRRMGIGGESTGYALKTATGSTIEIDLAANGLEASFVEGKEVSVTGTFRTIVGVEIPSRKVLVVSKIATK